MSGRWLLYCTARKGVEQSRLATHRSLRRPNSRPHTRPPAHHAAHAPPGVTRTLTAAPACML
jgi:hypothetical protein